MSVGKILLTKSILIFTRSSIKAPSTKITKPCSFGYAFRLCLGPRFYAKYISLLKYQGFSLIMARHNIGIIYDYIAFIEETKRNNALRIKD